MTKSKYVEMHSFTVMGNEPKTECLQGHSHSNHHGQDGGGFSAIFQLLPILLLVLVSLLSSLLVSDPLYRCLKFSSLDKDPAFSGPWDIVMHTFTQQSSPL